MYIKHSKPPVCSCLSQAMKIETGILTHSQAAELQFLRSRVRELEREKAAMASENQRLKNMLVKGETEEGIGKCRAC